MFRKRNEFLRKINIVTLFREKGESQMKIALIAHDKKKEEMIELAKRF